MPSYENIEVSFANGTSDFGVLYQKTAIAETAAAVATETLSRLLELSTTANASAVAWYAYAVAVDERANATDAETLKWTATLALSTTANATSEWTGNLTLALASSAVASAAATIRPIFAYNSVAAATSALIGARKGVATLTSTAVASGTLYEAYSVRLSSAGVATAAVTAVKKAWATETSSGVATSSIVSIGARTSYALESAAVARGSLTLQLRAVSALVSTANATSSLRSAFFAGSAYWCNAHTTAVSTWDIPINSAAQVGSTIFAAGAAGLYRLQDDSTEVVLAEIVYDLSDFNTAQRKKFDVVYVAGDSAGPFTVTATNEQGTWDYSTHLAEAEQATNQRAQLGRGLVSRYMRFTLANPDGGMFSVNEVGVMLGETTRRR